MTFYYQSLRSLYRTQLPTQRNMGPVTRQDDLHDCSGQTQNYLSSWLPAPNPFQPVVEVFLNLQFLLFLLDNNTKKYFFKITTKQYHILASLHITKWILLPQFQFLLWFFLNHTGMFPVRILTSYQEQRISSVSRHHSFKLFHILIWRDNRACCVTRVWVQILISK